MRAINYLIITSFHRVLLFTITFFLCVAQHSYAQDENELEANPPTLQIGLDQLAFKKGSLDAQLIMEIIAEKQEELKIKAIQSTFLRKVQNSGGTVYSFTDNIIRELVFEKDSEIRTRKVLENTVNLVFVTSYLNYYLSTLNKSDTSYTNFSKLANKFCINLDDIKNLNSFSNLKKNQESKEGKSEAYNEAKTVAFLALLIDMTSEVVRKDEKLKKLGLMQVSYSSTYEYMNYFIKVQKEKIDKQYFPYNIFKDKDIIKVIKDLSMRIKCDMEKHLSKFTDHIGLINFYVTEYSYRNEKLESFYSDLSEHKMSEGLDNRLDTLKNNIKQLIGSLTQKDIQDSLIKQELINLNKMYFYVDKAKKVIKNKEKFNSHTVADIIYTFHQEFRPLLLNQSYRDTSYLDLISGISIVSDDLAYLIRDSLITNDTLILNFENKKIDPFLLMVSKLYQFDKTSTISQYLTLIEDIGYIFPNDNIKDALSTVVTFVKDYTVILEEEKGKGVVSFNVESYILKLQNIKPYRWRRLEFNFTVGMNNAFFFREELKLNDSSSVRNLSYVGEKIGVKWKIIDKAFWHTRNIGDTYQMSSFRGKWWNPCTYSVRRYTYVKKTPPSEPLVSNWHLLLYSSGVLYNLVNTKTNSEFNLPIVGFGTGLTFYNALDLNISYGIPILPNSGFKKSFSNGFVSIGFDIQFIEYYQRLREKQKANRTQKQLIKAKN
ncbi:hypothetical protein ACE193_06995 [Bernardetia sp. OM2101]|uniref:hypothetical protein n=1 Tax=Bernardetia sp. OM2101 TaxID=3344876 RepID=UPI0035D0D52A